MDVKKAIETGDAAALRALLAEDPSRANQLIEWGDKGQIHTHPLHYVSDKLFDGTLERGKELPVINALLEAGADYNHQASNGETPLIGAASLAAEDVGLRLLEAGARPELTGGFGETALHWAAILGLPRLVKGLIEKGADVNPDDANYKSPPLGWAIHGRYNPLPGKQQGHPEVVKLLVAAGATVEPERLTDQKVCADPEMLSALEAGTGPARPPKQGR
jgi:hypothetical protein